MARLWIGIDPGLGGAIGYISPTGALMAWPTPVMKPKKGKSEYLVGAMATLVRNILQEHPGQQPAVILELVGSRPGQGVSSTCKLCRGLGIWEGICAGLQLPVVLTTPGKWKKFFGLDADKKSSLALGQRLFPSVPMPLVKDEARAEALLLAEYGRQTQPL